MLNCTRDETLAAPHIQPKCTRKQCGTKMIWTNLKMNQSSEFILAAFSCIFLMCIASHCSVSQGLLVDLRINVSTNAGNQKNLSMSTHLICVQSPQRNRSVVLAGPTMCAKTVGLNDMHLLAPTSFFKFDSQNFDTRK